MRGRRGLGETGGGLRERDEKREPGKKYHLFFGNKEDKKCEQRLEAECEQRLRA